MTKTPLKSEEELTNAKSSLRVWQEREDEHRETLRRLQAEIESKNHELDELSQQLTMRESLVAEIDTYEEVLNEIRGKTAESKGKLASVKDEVVKLQGSADEVRDQIRFENRRKSDVNDEITHLRQTSEFLTKRIAELKSEEERLNAQIAKQRATEKDQVGKIKEWESEIAEKNQECIRARSKVDDLERELNRKLSQSQTLDLEIQNRKETLRSFERDIEERKKVIAVQEQRLSDFESRNSQLLNQAAECERRTEDVRGEFAKLQVEIGTKSSELSHLLKTKERVIDEIADLNQRRESVRNDISSRAKDLETLEEKIAEKSASITGIEHTLSQVEIKLSQQEKMEAKYNDNINRLMEQNKYYEEKIAGIREKNVQEEMRGKVLSDDIRRKESAVNQIKEAEKNLDAKCETLRNSISKLTTDKQEITIAISDLAEKTRARENDYAHLGQKISGLQQRLGSLEGELKAQQDVLNQCEVEKVRKQTEIDHVTERLQTIRAQEMAAVSSRSTEEALLQSLKEQIFLSEKTLTDLVRQTEAERNRMIGERERAQVTHEEAEKAKNRLGELEKHVDEVTSHRDTTQMELLSLRKVALEKTEEISELEALRHDKLKRVDELRSEVAQLRREKLRQEALARQSNAQIQSRQSQKNLKSLKETLLKAEDDDSSSEAVVVDHKRAG